MRTTGKELFSDRATDGKNIVGFVQGFLREPVQMLGLLNAKIQVIRKDGPPPLL